MSSESPEKFEFSFITQGKWIKSAVCQQTDPQIFFPERGDRRTTYLAVSLCKTCPVIDECLSYALKFQINSNYGLFGIWGGTTEQERKKIIQKRAHEAS